MLLLVLVPLLLSYTFYIVCLLLFLFIVDSGVVRLFYIRQSILNRLLFIRLWLCLLAECVCAPLNFIKLFFYLWSHNDFTSVETIIIILTFYATFFIHSKTSFLQCFVRYKMNLIHISFRTPFWKCKTIPEINDRKRNWMKKQRENKNPERTTEWNYEAIYANEIMLESAFFPFVLCALFLLLHVFFS